ncbi:putative nicotinate-nucleotide adenylyltransferase [Compostibacillus humi]|uniref:Probable nicotinate-nucleotide adenylyltransferase n=1 Tax=Compostibacillus humi TaxID=1245525 RepID=A0A8J2ZNR2_9BACI|nr:nicotinate-nucleotide adenylyltransferase [Compostibacillus humi]GGH68350.1 putative nicotinate-nucleotide adenylyltransferase [Compostibacillus humi]
MRKIGILGGTFDPPHIGHLIIAEEVRIALKLEEIWFIPTYTPPHKEEAKTTARDRVQMTEIAISANPHFRLQTVEVERSGKSYTIDTIKQFRNEFPDVDFYFIIGADMVEYLPHWHRIEELVQLVKFVGVKRSGYELKTTYPFIEVEIPAIDISSSLLRERLRNGIESRYLIPDSVYAYIREKGLYEA